MRRIIYSFFIDIPDELLVSHHESKTKFADNYDWLLASQKRYAEKIGVEYKHFTRDKAFNDYVKWFNDNYPDISFYNIINFWKIRLMVDLAKEYDEVLYLDIDVIPVTDLNFFNEIDLTKGIAIMTGTHINQVSVTKDSTYRYTHHIRSPMAKMWNSRCMIAERGLWVDEPEVFNTAIVGVRKEFLDKLGYFDDFEDTLDLMTNMISDVDFYPESISYMFGYDNETVWGYKTYINKVEYQELGGDWHYIMDKWSYVNKNAKFIHCISKDFDYVRKWCEKNNIQLI